MRDRRSPAGGLRNTDPVVGRGRWGVRGVLGLLAGLSLLFGAAGPAAAHAALVSTGPAEASVLPASPGEATLTFNEPISLPAQGVHVFDAQGSPVQFAASSRDARVQVDLPDQLAQGTYVVAWRVISADGHPVAGSLSFAVGKPSVTVVAAAPPDPTSRAVTVPLSIAQALTYLGLLCAVGLAVFEIALLDPGADAARPRRRMRALIRIASAGCAFGALLTLPLTVVNQQGLGLSDVVTPSGWRGAAAADVLNLVGLLGGVALLFASMRCRLPEAARRALCWVGVVVAGTAPALSGHSRAFEPIALLITTDVLHVLAGSIWFGGLVGLLLTLPSIADQRAEVAQTLARFSTVAAAVLGVLLASGSLQAWRILGSWQALFHTTYGWLLLAKVAIVGVTALVAAYNRYVLLPRSRTGERSGIARVIAAEAALLVVVVGLTGFLVHQSPVVETLVVPDGRTGVATAPLGENAKVLATMGPSRVGLNTVRVQVQDLAGEPIETPDPPVVRVFSAGLDVGKVSLTGEAAGTFRGSVVVPSAGAWKVQVSVRLSELDNPIGVVEFSVAG